MATVNLSDYKAINITNADTFTIGIVVSEWNDFITGNLKNATIEILEKEGVLSENIKIHLVPGAFELNFASMQLCKSGKHDVVIAIGCVIRGETPHFDYVSAEVSKGIAQVGMSAEIPVIFGVLTTDSIEQAIERAGTKAGNKGFDAAMSAIEMANIFKQLG